VKNIPKAWSDDKLKEYFEQFGTLSSVKVELDQKGESKGFGFVCFEESDSAKTCIEKANKLKMDNGDEL
jgi:polyadenylate-binding protein